MERAHAPARKSKTPQGLHVNTCDGINLIDNIEIDDTNTNHIGVREQNDYLI